MLVTGSGWHQHSDHLGNDHHPDGAREKESSVPVNLCPYAEHRVPPGWCPSIPPLLLDWQRLPRTPLQGLPPLEEPLHLAGEARDQSRAPGRKSLLGGGETISEDALLLLKVGEVEDYPLESEAGDREVTFFN